MASKTHIRLIIFVLFLSNILSTTFSSLQTTYLQREEKNLRNWISWNLQNYQNKKKAANFQSAESQFSQERATNIGEVRLHLDMKLQIAEMNKRIIVVSQDGTGDFKTINEAIDTIPLHNTRRVILDIKPGIYREKITIPKTMAFVTLLGNSSDPPTITGNDTASVTGRDGMPLKTFQSATVAVDADYFVAINLKFENTAPHVVGVLGGQAVALRISGTKAAFYNCSFYGSQDTLYDHKGVHYFNNCFIQGSVDFIFGYARSLYENCVLNSVAKKVASLTAQKRSKTSMSSGFSFKSCNITGSGQVYLGRAWGDYSRVVFSYSYMDNIVLPQGWSDWGKRSRDRKVYYGEYKCSGPGANLSGRVPWAHVLSDEEAMPFIGSYYVDGETWLIDPLGS